MIPPEVLTSGNLVFEGMSSDASEEDWSAIEARNASWKFRSNERQALQTKSPPDLSCHPISAETEREHVASTSGVIHGERDDGVSNIQSTTLSRPADISISPSSEDAFQTSTVLRSTPTVELDVTTTFIAEGLESLPSGLTNHPVKRTNTAGGIRTITREALLSRSSTTGQRRGVTAKKKNSRQGSGDVKKQMPYFEVAVDLMSRLPGLATKQLFRNLRFFLVTQEASGAAATEATKRKLEILIRHGGQIQAKFEPETVTHIICDLPKMQSRTRVVLKERLDGMPVEDVPHHIRIVKWSWVTDSINSGMLVDQLKAEVYITRVNKAMTSALKNKRPRSSSRANSPAQLPSDSIQETECFDDLEQRSIPSKTLRSAESDVQNCDPLHLFYNEALYGHGDEEDSVEEASQASASVYKLPETSTSKTSMYLKKKGYACNEVDQRKGSGLNDDIIDKLQELLRIHETSRNKDDQWRVMSYRRAIGSLRRCFKRITTAEDAKRLPGVGEKTALKIEEIIQTGELQRLSYEKTEERAVCNVLCGIYGVGPTTAFKWYKAGVRTLDDVRWGKGEISLTEAQAIGLQHYEDLQDRMPREEAAAIFEKIKTAAISIDPKLEVEVMGSYRRGQMTCGDIDVLLTRCTDDGRTHRGVLSRLLHLLQEQGILTHTLGAPDLQGDGLEAKFMGLCRLNDASRYRRLDILTIPFEQWGASLIYFTGDDIFNRSMRLLARHKGFSLNQRGLWAGVSREYSTGLKTTEGTIVASKTEKEIFAALGVPWQEPHERIRAR